MDRISNIESITKPVKANFLWRRRLKAWKKWWFVLKGKTLMVFSKSEDGVRGAVETIIPLDRFCFIQQVDFSVFKRKHVFKITDKGQTHVHYLAGDREEEVREWCMQILIEAARDGPALYPRKRPLLPDKDKEKPLFLPPAASSSGIQTPPTTPPASMVSDDTPVDHLILVVHGVGGQLVNDKLLHHVEDLRRAKEAVLLTAFPDADYNVEFLEVEWHSGLRALSGCEERIRRCTPRSLPKLRAFLNDKVLDVCYFLTPRYHKFIVDEVAQLLNRRYHHFIAARKNFSGRVSILAHSLGGVVAYDILCHQHLDSPFFAAASRDISDDLGVCYEEPCGRVKEYNVRLDFVPQHLFAMGCPLGVFLSLRGESPNLSRLPFRLHNIYHPNDAVAFRIEPMVDPAFQDVSPVLLTHWRSMQERTKYSEVLYRVSGLFGSASASGPRQSPHTLQPNLDNVEGNTADPTLLMFGDPDNPETLDTLTDRSPDSSMTCAAPTLNASTTTGPPSRSSSPSSAVSTSSPRPGLSPNPDPAAYTRTSTTTGPTPTPTAPGPSGRPNGSLTNMNSMPGPVSTGSTASGFGSGGDGAYASTSSFGSVNAGNYASNPARGSGATTGNVANTNVAATSWGGPRVDIVLQDSVGEDFRTYLSLLSSHVCYWSSKDAMLYVLATLLSDHLGPTTTTTTTTPPKPSLSARSLASAACDPNSEPSMSHCWSQPVTCSTSSGDLGAWGGELTPRYLGAGDEGMYHADPFSVSPPPPPSMRRLPESLEVVPGTRDGQGPRDGGPGTGCLPVEAPLGDLSEPGPPEFALRATVEFGPGVGTGAAAAAAISESESESVAPRSCFPGLGLSESESESAAEGELESPVAGQRARRRHSRSASDLALLSPVMRSCLDPLDLLQGFEDEADALMGTMANIATMDLQQRQRHHHPHKHLPDHDLPGAHSLSHLGPSHHQPFSEPHATCATSSPVSSAPIPRDGDPKTATAAASFASSTALPTAAAGTSAAAASLSSPAMSPKYRDSLLNASPGNLHTTSTGPSTPLSLLPLSPPAAGPPPLDPKRPDHVTAFHAPLRTPRPSPASSPPPGAKVAVGVGGEVVENASSTSIAMAAAAAPEAGSRSATNKGQTGVAASVSATGSTSRDPARQPDRAPTLGQTRAHVESFEIGVAGAAGAEHGAADDNDDASIHQSLVEEQHGPGRPDGGAWSFLII